jgi:hypothetical protein
MGQTLSYNSSKKVVIEVVLRLQNCRQAGVMSERYRRRKIKKNNEENRKVNN